MTSGLLGELTALANAWTAGSTWRIFSTTLGAGLLCLLLRGVAGARSLADGRDGGAWPGFAIAGLLFAAALVLRLLLPERVHYTFNDEYEYIDHAQRLLASGEYRLWSGPPAGVYLYALAFAVFGVSTAVAFATTIVLASLTPPVFYWTLRVLRVERMVAVVAAVLLVLAPLHVKHAASASLEIASLLLLLLTVGSFLELLRAPGAVAATCFATSLFFALTVRVENWALLVLLPLLWRSWRGEVRRLSAGHFLLAALAVALAAAYLPGILAAPIRYDPWWQSRLPGPALLLTNLGFWVGGDVLQRKLPLLLFGVGVIAGLRRARPATVFWIAFLLLYSIVFVLYGLNVGWLEEAHQPPPWGARDAGHDMFRFNVILLPAVTYLLASGVVAVLRAIGALLRADFGNAARSRPVRIVAVVALCVVGPGLLLWRGEYAAYRPLAFLASPYNRGFEIAEFRFLHAALAGGARGGALYVLPPTEGIVVDDVAARPLASLATDLAANPDAAAFVYVNGRQLAAPALEQAFRAAQQRVALREVERRLDGRERFYLFAVVPHVALPTGGSAAE